MKKEYAKVKLGGRTFLVLASRRSVVLAIRTKTAGVYRRLVKKNF